MPVFQPASSLTRKSALRKSSQRGRAVTTGVRGLIRALGRRLVAVERERRVQLFTRPAERGPALATSPKAGKAVTGHRTPKSSRHKRIRTDCSIEKYREDGGSSPNSSPSRITRRARFPKQRRSPVPSSPRPCASRKSAVPSTLRPASLESPNCQRPDGHVGHAVQSIGRNPFRQALKLVSEDWRFESWRRLTMGRMSGSKSFTSIILKTAVGFERKKRNHR